jgi:hypothetical protein
MVPHRDEVSLPMKKYPNIPHIPGSQLASGDMLSDNYPIGEFYVYEKLDGASLGISKTSKGYRLQNRGAYLEHKRPHPQWEAAKNWVYMNYEVLDRFFEGFPRGTLFGEWLYAKHSIWYPALESYFIGYDVWTGNEFLPDSLTIQEIITTVGLVPSPIITATNNIAEFLASYTHKPIYDSNEYEGFIFRSVKNHAIVHKWVRPGFLAGSEDGWFGAPLVKNALACL